MKKSICLAGILFVLALTINGQNDTMNVMQKNIVGENYNVNTEVESATSIMTDSRDGNSYHVVKIGNQIWMAENLRYLPSVTGPGKGSEKKPYYYVYGYDGTNVSDAKATANYNTYGVLYNWPAAMNEAASITDNPGSVQGVCPSGWHLPSDAEWLQMTNYVDTSFAGGKLKEKGTTHWNRPNTGATNKTGFTARAGGYRKEDGSFVSMGEDSDFWSATEYNTSYAWFRNIHFNESDVGRNNFNKEIGFSIRCVKD